MEQKGRKEGITRAHRVQCMDGLGGLVVDPSTIRQYRPFLASRCHCDRAAQSVHRLKRPADGRLVAGLLRREECEVHERAHRCQVLIVDPRRKIVRKWDPCLLKDGKRWFDVAVAA